MLPITELHLNSTTPIKPDQEIDTMPHVFMTNHPPTVPIIEETTPKPDHVLAGPKGVVADGDALSATIVPAPTGLPANIQVPDVDGKTSEKPPEVSFWEKVGIGLRCSMRDCRDALLPTGLHLRELTAPTVVRRIRGHDAIICTCGIRENRVETP